MDWIKQIIECKKENWVSPGSLGQELLKFLEKEGEERRNFYVASVENTGEKNYKAVLDFVTKRSDGKNITVTFEDGTYTFSLE